MPLKNRYLRYIWTGLALCFPTGPFPRPHSIGNPLIPLSCESITVATCSEEEDSNDPKWTSFSGLCLFLHQWKHPFYFGNHISVNTRTWFSLSWLGNHVCCEHGKMVLSQLTRVSEYMSEPDLVGCPEKYLPSPKLEATQRGRGWHTPLEFIHIWLLASHPCLPSTHSPESSENVRSLWSK